MQEQRTIFFLTYLSTPVIFVIGSILMYFLIGQHEHFWGILGFYFVALTLLYFLKLGVLKKMLKKAKVAEVDPDAVRTPEPQPEEETHTEA